MNKETQSFVYMWVHKPSQRWYIGSRTAKNCNINDGYICSSKHVKPLIVENFKEWERKIIATGSKDYIRKLESEILISLDAKNNPKSLNRSNNIKVPLKTSAEGKIRIHKDNLDIFVKKDELSYYIENGWKLGFSLKARNNMKANHANVSGENNPMYGTKRLGNNQGFKHSQETINKLKVPKSKEHKEKLSVSKLKENNPMYGKKQNRICCEKCNKEIPVNIYGRFHGLKCKNISKMK